MLDSLSYWLHETPLGEALLTMFISMLPVVELRGGLPAGVAMGLPLREAFFAALLGNLLPVPFIILFARRGFAWVRAHIPRLGRWVDRIERKAWSKSDKVVRYQAWGLLLFVAVPLPGTGAWTGALIAALSKATKVIVKSPHEAIGIPTMEANAQGLRCTRQVVSMMSEQTFANTHLDEEMEIIRQETRCIVDKCFELGRGDIALGVCRGVKAGVLDVPFAPCRYNAGQMLPCRDNDGAVRIMNMGNLPFTKELRDYHMGKIAERAAFEHRKATFQMVTDDVYAISKGRLVGRPR